MIDLSFIPVLSLLSSLQNPAAIILTALGFVVGLMFAGVGASLLLSFTLPLALAFASATSPLHAQATQSVDSFSTRWEERRAAILAKMESWIRAQGRWDVYQTYLQKYTSPEWVKRQFPAYGPDSLELARRMLMPQAAQMAVEYTPAELAALEKQGFNPVHYFMERHDAWSVETQMIRNEEAVVVKPIRAELSEMADGFGSNGIFEVVEALKGSLKPGDTIRIRQRSSMAAAHPTDLIPLNMRDQMSRGVMDQQTLVYLTRKGGMRYTTAPGRTPVHLPAGVYYLGNSVPVSDEQLHPKDLMALSHPTTMAEVRRVAERFAK